MVNVQDKDHFLFPARSGGRQLCRQIVNIRIERHPLPGKLLVCDIYECLREVLLFVCRDKNEGL